MKKEEIKIRKATLNDLNEIIKLNQELFNYEYKKVDKTLDCNWPRKNKKYFVDAIKKPNSFTLVAVSDNKIVGYFIGSIHEAEKIRNIKKIAEADDSYILSKYRRKGIGTRFMKQFLIWAKSKKIKRAMSVVNAKNSDSISFNKKNGFNEYFISFEKEIK